MAQEKAQEISAQPTATENVGVQTQRQRDMQQLQQARPCPQDCRMCQMAQQIFCATKMLFDLSRQQQVLRDQVSELTKEIGILRDQMKSMDDDGQLSIPFVE
jgi:hypothetical protein